MVGLEGVKEMENEMEKIAKNNLKSKKVIASQCNQNTDN
jgi:hypothetical protein